MNLTEKRAADRAKMAAILISDIVGCGATVEREEGTGPKHIMLRVEAPGGLRVWLDLDGASPQPDVHMLSWHIASPYTARLNDATFGGNVNPHHRMKATYIAEGFEDLREKLKRGLTMAADGSAYLPESTVSAA